MKIIYQTNNSGGKWWLTEQDWKDLESAGWNVEWNDWLGAAATKASRESSSMCEAIAEFEEVTGCNTEDEGCPCCGRPHYFYVD